MATYRKRFGGKFRLGTRKNGTTFNLGRIRKPKPVKMGTVPKPRLTNNSVKYHRVRRAMSRGTSLFRGRRRSTAGLGGLIVVLIIFGLIGHFIH
jgi:hypothetical protein